MKYRVRIDLPFEDEADVRALMNYAKSVSSKAASIGEGSPSEEIAFCELEICRHDDPSSGKGCEKLERVEIRKLLPK